MIAACCTRGQFLFDQLLFGFFPAMVGVFPAFFFLRGGGVVDIVFHCKVHEYVQLNGARQAGRDCFQELALHIYNFKGHDPSNEQRTKQQLVSFQGAYFT